jgi:Membrane domain of glycerophosphoryl diester phosphodiesterase
MSEVDLRPMTLGEVLDRTFKLYRSNFWLFAGIIALPYLLILLVEVVSAAFGSAAKPAQGVPQISPSLLAGALAGGTVVAILYAIMAGAAHAATVFAVSDLYLARPATVRGSFSRVGARVFRVLLVFLLIGLAIGVSVTVIMVAGAITKSPAIMALGLIVFIVPCIIFLCRVAVAIPVAMLEDLGAVRSLERSIQLTKGHAAQIFLIFLLVGCLSYVALLLLQAPFVALAVRSVASHQSPSFGVEVLQYLSAFVSQVLIGPIATIALSLMYYNLRVRKEAFDIQHLMASLGPSASPSAPSAA